MKLETRSAKIMLIVGLSICTAASLVVMVAVIAWVGLTIAAAPIAAIALTTVIVAFSTWLGWKLGMTYREHYRRRP